MLFNQKYDSLDRVPSAKKTVIFCIIFLFIALIFTFVFSPLLALGFLGLSAVSAVLLYDLRIGLLALVLSSAFAAAISPLFSVRFAHFHVSHLLSILLLAVFAIESLRRRELRMRAETHIDAPLILLSLTAVVSLFNSYLFWDSAVSLAHRHLIVQVTGIALILFPVSLFLIMVRRVTSMVWVKIFYYSLIAVSFVAALLAMALHPFGIRFFNPDGVMLDMGILYVVGFPLAFAGLLWSKRLWHSLIWGLLAGTILLDIVAFHHYGERTLIAIAVSFLAIGFLRSKKLFILFLVLLVLVAAVKSDRVKELIFSPNESLHFRLILWKDTFNVLSQHWSFWLVGVGPGNYYAYSLVYSFNATDQGAWGLTTPHSQYFGILGELGIAGLVLFLWFLANVLRRQFSLFVKTKEPFSQAFRAGTIGSFIGIVFLCILSDSLIPSVSNYGFDRICTSIYPWILLGMAYSRAWIDEKKRGQV